MRPRDTRTSAVPASKRRSGTRPVTWTRRHRLLCRPASAGPTVPRAAPKPCSARGSRRLPPFSGSLARGSRVRDAPRAYSRSIIASTLYPTGRRRSCQGNDCVRTIRKTSRGPQAVPVESIPRYAHRNLNGRVLRGKSGAPLCIKRTYGTLRWQRREEEHRERSVSGNHSADGDAF